MALQYATEDQDGTRTHVIWLLCELDDLEIFLPMRDLTELVEGFSIY